MARPAKDVLQQQQKPKGKSSSKTAAANTKKKISTAKPNSKAPMLASDFYESAYLKGTDIALGDEEEVTLDCVTVETLGEGDDQKKKPCLHFREIEKSLIANKTNRTVLVEALGNDMSRWPGHRVVLFSQMVPFKGKPVQSMRLRMPTPKGSGSRGGLHRKG